MITKDTVRALWDPEEKRDIKIDEQFVFLIDALAFRDLYLLCKNVIGKELQTKMIEQYPERWMQWLFDRVGTFS